MSEANILKKAIKKAVKNGWKSLVVLEFYFEEAIGRTAIKHLIFSHDFAKVFWGEKKIGCGDNGCGGSGSKCCGRLRVQTSEQIAWQYHLQQMVLEKEPIKYLEKFL